MANITNWRLLEVFLRLDDVCDRVKADIYDTVLSPVRHRNSGCHHIVVFYASLESECPVSWVAYVRLPYILLQPVGKTLSSFGRDDDVTIFLYGLSHHALLCVLVLTCGVVDVIIDWLFHVSLVKEPHLSHTALGYYIRRIRSLRTMEYAIIM